MTTEREHRSLEGYMVTPELLFKANQSELSKRRIGNYYEAKSKGDLTLLISCADARSGPSIFNYDALAVDRSVAAGMSAGEYAFAIRHRGIGQIVIATHFDGTQSEELGRFTGCGGLRAYNDFCGEAVGQEIPPIGKHIQAHVYSDNPFVQAFKQKDAVMKFQADQEDACIKPIMIGAIDHRSGLFLPVWELTFDDTSGVYHTQSTIQSHHIQNPEFITPKNLHELPIEALSADFQSVVHHNRDQAEFTRITDPKFSESQAVQNPHAIVATTSLIPLRNRYAGLFDQLNDVFVVGISKVKKPDGTSVVTNIENVFSQLDFPITNALHAASSTEPFGKTDTIIFETHNIGESDRLARDFAKIPYAHDWVRDRSVSILIAETRGGITTKVFEFDK